MGISERKEREKAEMKERILDAALKMFLEEGYAKTSIRNIADAIEYSPGTIYLYFKDKDELLYEVQGEAYLKLLQAFKKNVTNEDPVERLGELARTYIDFGLENPELYDLMFIIRAPMNVEKDEHEGHGGDSFAFLVNCLKACMEKNLLIFKDVNLAALQLWSIVHGLVSLNLRCRLRIMITDETQVRGILFKAAEEYLDSIRA